MTKKELARIVAKQENITQRTASEMIDTIFMEIQKALADGNKVTLPGFGTFQVRRHRARQVYNPRTGQKVFTQGGAAPVFKASGVFRKAVTEQQRDKA